MSSTHGFILVTNFYFNDQYLLSWDLITKCWLLSESPPNSIVNVGTEPAQAAEIQQENEVHFNWLQPSKGQEAGLMFLSSLSLHHFPFRKMQ